MRTTWTKRIGIILAALLLLCLAGCGKEEAYAKKPVIYLYPDQQTLVSLRLDLDGPLTASYPAHGTDGWQVIAHPDGTLTDPDTGRSYYCLFWEGKSQADYDLSSGFVVAGEETAAFLEEALAQLGLTEREANEFLIYWLPGCRTTPITSSPSRTPLTPTPPN